jgi:hypothetical protein
MFAFHPKIKPETPNQIFCFISGYGEPTISTILLIDQKMKELQRFSQFFSKK